jgi:hypothetical protein
MKEVKLIQGNTLTQKNMKLLYHLTDPRLEVATDAIKGSGQMTA